jgi:methylase of polypeptide subunit release factors
MDPSGDKLLVLASQGDERRLSELRRRYADGEPAPYLAGFFYFDGLRFSIDQRAYITDPELVHLVRAVEAEAGALSRTTGTSPLLLDFGVGCGSLALRLKLAHPDWSIVGLDIDDQALEVAMMNSLQHQMPLRLLQSDYFSGWPKDLPGPTLIYGDPPWGTPTDLYEENRDGAYYDRMPPLSAYPGGEGPCSVHDRLIREAIMQGWTSTLVLNYGVLPREVIERSAAPLLDWRIEKPVNNVSLLIGRLGRKTGL